jgi:hypothetical protein
MIAIDARLNEADLAGVSRVFRPIFCAACITTYSPKL